MYIYDQITNGCNSVNIIVELKFDVARQVRWQAVLIHLFQITAVSLASFSMQSAPVVTVDVQ